jgi:hypothetical protein
VLRRAAGIIATSNDTHDTRSERPASLRTVP